MALGYSSTVHALYMEILSTWKIKRTIKRKKRKMGRRLPISRNSTREPRKFAGFPREFVTFRVVQFVLKLAHLAISMEPRRPCTCSLLPRLWLLIMPSSLVVRHYEIFCQPHYQCFIRTQYPGGASLTQFLREKARKRGWFSFYVLMKLPAYQIPHSGTGRFL